LYYSFTKTGIPDQGRAYRLLFKTMTSDSALQIPHAPQDRRQCICAKTSCEELRQQVLLKAPDDHPWKVGNGFTEIRQHKIISLTVEAIKKSCAFHFSLDPDDASKAKYCVANLHWPVTLLKEKKYRACLLSATEAKDHDGLAGYAKRFFDTQNKVGYILKKVDVKVIDREAFAKIAEQYVQAPVCTQADVREEIKSMTSLRATRREKIEVCTLRSRKPKFRRECL
jgi:hypothetical protein